METFSSHCSSGTLEKIVEHGLKKIAVVGHPNVGKSVLFNNLTRRYVTVANYPGTTVQVSRGKARMGQMLYEAIDTPGMYSFFPITEEEKVAREILIYEKPYLVIHVVDAKNLERMLPLTFQLLEASLPVLLVLNMMDEAEREGIDIDIKSLEQELNVSVVATVSTTGRGIQELKEKIENHTWNHCPWQIPLDSEIESSLLLVENLLENDYVLSKRSIALLLLAGDEEIEGFIRKKQPAIFEKICVILKEERPRLRRSVEYESAIRFQKHSNKIAAKVVKEAASKSSRSLGEKLSRLTMNPVTGLPILFLILYFGLYKFVGEFGAGIVVDFIEGTIFEQYFNPWVVQIVSQTLPWQILQDLLVGEYGVITLGFRYAVALILPIVGFFFIVFSIIEDSGYLPRLAMLIDRLFKKIGLSGRAVIPMVLGFGCDTMATMVTRTLPTRRERVISTLLLALAIPCSAQLGVILALLAGRPIATLIWTAVVGLVFLLVGFLAAQILPGERPIFFMEIPPLRWPKVSNVLVKTYVRVKWYFNEVLPLFLWASVFIWLGQRTRLFDLGIELLSKPVRLLGLPPESAKIFLFGFFRRDYGAAGLYDLAKHGLLDTRQLVVACVALTLFLPCIAQFLMNVKERGWKTGLAISVFILFLSFGVAFLLNQGFNAFGVSL